MSAFDCHFLIVISVRISLPYEKLLYIPIGLDRSLLNNLGWKHSSVSHTQKEFKRICPTGPETFLDQQVDQGHPSTEVSGRDTSSRSLGTPHCIEDEDKRRHLGRAYHSPSSPPRNHTTVRSSRRSVEHTKLIAICFEQENTFSFSQFALFNQYFRNPWANPQGNLDNRKTRPVCVQRAPQIDQLQPITSSQEIEERPRT